MLGMHLTDERIEGFCKVSVCENVTESAVTIMHHAGIGSLQPNTVSIPSTCSIGLLARCARGGRGGRLPESRGTGVGIAGSGVGVFRGQGIFCSLSPGARM